MTSRGRATRPAAPSPRRAATGSTASRAATGSTASRGSRGSGGGRPDSATARRSLLRAAIEPVVASAGFDLEQVTVSRAGRRHLVRVIIDGDGGVSMDAVADVSRALSAALDAAEQAGPALVPGEYVLEVSSPGVDRPLTEPRHWRRNVGRLVTVAVTEGPASHTVTGRITAATDSAVVLDLDGVVREVPRVALGPGRIQVEFQRPGEDTDEGVDGARDGEDLGGGGT
jgi:ribosome maturation factor RimP